MPISSPSPSRRGTCSQRRASFTSIPNGTAVRLFQRVWQTSPLVTVLVHRALTSAMPDTTATDRIENSRGDKKLFKLDVCC
jgi:hypothetical protein